MNVQRIVHPSQSIGIAAIPTYLLLQSMTPWSGHSSRSRGIILTHLLLLIWLLTAEDAQDGGYCAYNKEEENETLVRLSNGYIETNSKWLMSCFPMQCPSKPSFNLHLFAATQGWMTMAGRRQDMKMNSRILCVLLPRRPGKHIRDDADTERARN